MGLFDKLLSRLFDRKHAQSCSAVNPPQIQSASFYRPDTRTEAEKEAEKQVFLHPDALEVATGVCAQGQAAHERMIQAFGEELLGGVEYSAVPDNCCCPECWPLDGQRFPLDITKRPPIPRHPGCRCLYVPKTKTWREMGLDIDDLKPAERRWIVSEYQYTYKKDTTKKLKKPKRTIVRCVTFKGPIENMIKKLPVNEQRQFFASEIAYKLWYTGKIKAIDLINPETWKLRTDFELLELSQR